jgi:RNA polymerase sigma factor (sigma-70 family)
MRFTITARLRHGPLWDAVKRHGSIKKMSDSTGIPYGTLQSWIGLREIPSVRKWEQYGSLLVKETGKEFDELFPAEIRTRKFLDIPKITEITKDIPNHLLSGMGQSRFELPSPEDAMIQEDSKKVIHDLMEKRLGWREKAILKMRLGLDGSSPMTLESVGKVFKVTREKIRQVEARAIRKLSCLRPDKEKLEQCLKG